MSKSQPPIQSDDKSTEQLESKPLEARSRLTLKFKPANQAPLTSNQKQHTIKIDENNRKFGSSLVQVTIKGRKGRDPSPQQDLSPSRESLEKSSEISPQVAQINTVKKIPEVVETPPKPEINKGYQVDDLDVRNKIRKSIEAENQLREEREKALEAKPKILKDLVPEEDSKPKKFEIAEKAKKPSFKDEKFSKHKLVLSTDDGSDDYRNRRKWRPKIKQKPEQTKEYKKISHEVLIPELITIADLAERMAEKNADLVKKLFTMGMMVTSNQTVDADTAEILVTEFGHTAKRVSNSDVEKSLEEDDAGFEKLARAPVVTIMGHVDHGKTSLLDAIRSTNVVSGEHGGITQHIGASRIETLSGKFITFLDTPGHEAFTEMRLRGANATDIVVLVVAADDGVKEQTIEAINHAKAANVPIIVAINKIDKPGGDPTRVKNELLNHGIVSEDLGGDVMFVQVSAKQRLNLDKLEEAILLQAEVLELKSVYDGKASGVVIESKVDPAKGVTVTVLIQKGVLNLSDLIVAGATYGRVRKMTDDHGKNIKIATPSMPVEILGLSSAPNAGDKFAEVDEEKQARDIIAYRARKDREKRSLMASGTKSLADLFKTTGKIKHLNVIIKGDVHGSVEAVQGSLTKLNTQEVAIKVIHFATGGIIESDINLASVSDAIIIGFNVRANSQATEMARQKGVEIRYYSIIYNVVDDLKLLLSGLLEPTKREDYLGRAEIRQIFKVTGSGKVAGGTVIDGEIRKSARVRLLRDSVVIFDGSLKALKRFKDDVKQVKEGFECGLSLENYDDIKEKDIIECYEIVEQKRSL